MPINFPDAPSSGDTHTVGDKTWTYDGTAWNVVQNNIADHGNLGGLGDDDHTQYLLADGSRTATELTVTNTLTVDTDTLHVDSTNDRVGIGTTSPTQILDIQDADNAEINLNDSGGTVGTNTNAKLQFQAGGADAGHVGFNNTSSGIITLTQENGALWVNNKSANNI